MAEGRVSILFGTGSVGHDGEKFLNDVTKLKEILDEYKKRGHNEIDTARVYGNSTAESILSEAGYLQKGFSIDTKIASFFPHALSAANLNKSFTASLTALNTNKVNVLYLHSPERATPLHETLNAVNELYKTGQFKEFGLSNYPAYEVNQILQICESKGYVKPTVYQGMYNLFARTVEQDLFPLIRKHGLRFVAYSPVASFFTQDMQRDIQAPHWSRFDATTPVGRYYRAMFFKESFFKALDKIREAGKQYNISVTEIAIRWLVHHSQLRAEFRDGIVFGGKGIEHVRENLDSAEKPPLPDDVVQAITSVWDQIKADAPPYYR